MKITPNAFMGYSALPFIITLIILIIGEVALTILFFDLFSFYLLIAGAMSLLVGAGFIYRARTSSFTLTETGIEEVNFGKSSHMSFGEMSGVVYTENAYVGNTRKPCLYFLDASGKVQHSLCGISWNMKDIKAVYDAIPESSVEKSVAERGY
ncbi:hypothetical protein BGO17_02290 [Candidatus Saccharibacteria bacterium 49-20]|nr:MAG: hypothetical protein BGO17_02290 [Candidatus Saccharibacteria bacterium 49-20]